MLTRLIIIVVLLSKVQICCATIIVFIITHKEIVIASDSKLNYAVSPDLIFNHPMTIDKIRRFDPYYYAIGGFIENTNGDFSLLSIIEND